MEKNYSTFNLAFRESEGRLAIWYKSPSGKDCLVSPLDFFNAIVGDKYEIWSLVRRKEDILLGSTGLHSHLIFEDDTCFIIVDDSTLGQDETQRISIDDFLTQTETCFLELYTALKSGVETFYKERVKEADISIIV